MMTLHFVFACEAIFATVFAAEFGAWVFLGVHAMLAGIMAFEIGPVRRVIGAVGLGTDESTSLVKVVLLMLTGVTRMVIENPSPCNDIGTSWKAAESFIHSRSFRDHDQFLPIS
jgi:hypothetical protein